MGNHCSNTVAAAALTMRRRACRICITAVQLVLQLPCKQEHSICICFDSVCAEALQLHASHLPVGNLPLAAAGATATTATRARAGGHILPRLKVPGKTAAAAFSSCRCIVCLSCSCAIRGLSSAWLLLALFVHACLKTPRFNVDLPPMAVRLLGREQLLRFALTASACPLPILLFQHPQVQRGAVAHGICQLCCGQARGGCGGARAPGGAVHARQRRTGPGGAVRAAGQEGEGKE